VQNCTLTGARFLCREASRRADLARRKGLPSVEDQTIELDCAVVLYPRMSLPIASPARAPDEGAVIHAVVHSARPVGVELFHRLHAEVTPAKALRCLRSRKQPVPWDAMPKKRAAAFGKAAASPPKWIKPQLSRLVDEAPTGADWLHEIKYDGYRMHARLEDGRAQLLTRTGLDWSKRYRWETGTRTF